MECSIAGKRMIMDRKRMAKGCVSLRILKLSHFFVTQENENLKKTNTDSNQKVLIDNIFVMFGGRVFQQIVRYTYGYKLCSSSRRIVPLFV